MSELVSWRALATPHASCLLPETGASASVVRTGQISTLPGPCVETFSGFVYTAFVTDLFSRNDLAMSAATIVRVSDSQIIRSGASLTACPVTGTVVQAGGRRVLQEQNQSQRVTLSRGGYAAGTPSMRADSSARTAQRGAQSGRFGAGLRPGPRS